MSAQIQQKTDEPVSLFEQVQWVPLRDQTGPYEMLSEIRDLAAGVGLTLAMIERTAIAQDLGDVPLLEPRHVCALTRMSIAVMNVIEERIDEHFDGMHDRGAEQRRAEKLREQL
jgi:hypothetical protein